MRIIISTTLRQQLLAAEQLDKTELSKILHFKRNGLRARKLRANILNHHNFILDGEN